ncbi:hypothetical protein [Pedobacter panaciterrae]
MQTSDGSEFIKLRPLWKDSWTVKSNGNSLLIVPTIENYVENKNIQIRRVFIFSKNGNEITGAKIVEFVAKNFDLEHNLNNVISNYKNNSISNFNGSVLIYDINYISESSAVYENGKKTNRKAGFIKAKNLRGNIKLSQSSRDGAKITSTNLLATLSGKRDAIGAFYCNGCPTTMAPNCLYTFSYTNYYDSKGNITDTVCELVSVICTNPGGSGSGSGSGSGAPNGSGSGSGTIPWWMQGAYGGNSVVKTVKDFLTDLCLKAQLALAKDAKTKIKDMLDEAFTGEEYEDMNIEFRDVTTLPANVAGTTHWENSQTAVVELNKSFGASHANEYNLATIYHEVLHAFITAKYPTTPDGIIPIPDHHAKIADDYLVFLVAAVRAVYPNTSLRDAWALAWGGLEETPFYLTKLTAAERTEIQTILANYKKTAAVLTRKGTYCNP